MVKADSTAGRKVTTRVGMFIVISSTTNVAAGPVPQAAMRKETAAS